MSAYKRTLHKDVCSQDEHELCEICAQRCTFIEMSINRDKGTKTIFHCT